MSKTYLELISIDNYYDRLKYLLLSANVGDITFGGQRHLNQTLYQSAEWKSIKQRIILRDNGCDLGCEDYPIKGSIYIHHIEPITIDDILDCRKCVFDMNNLISTSFKTHNMIHYGIIDDIPKSVCVTRTKNDTCPWKT